MRFFSRRDKDGYDKNGFNKEGYNPQGFSKEGNDKFGFNLDGIHNITKTIRDESGFDEWGKDGGGFGRDGYASNGIARDGYDKDGYDERGFNIDGIHRETRKKFNPQGEDVDGYDKAGFRYLIHRITGTKYDESGHTISGFDKYGIHKKTGTHLDEFDMDVNGKYGLPVHCPKCNSTNHSVIDRFSDAHHTCCMPDLKKDDPPNTKCCSCGHKWYFFHPLFFHQDSFFSGRDKDGIHKNEFNKEGNHKVTGTRYDLEGYDENGFDKKGIHKVTGTKFDEEGYDKDGYDEKGFNRNGYDKDGYDLEGYDKNGFDKDGVHRETKVGYDHNSCPPPKHPEFKKSYRRIGYNDDGFDENGFTTSGIHQTTGTKYDLDGNDQHGFDEKGIHKVTKTKFDEEGFDSDGIHKVTKTKFDEDGYDKDGHWEHDEILNILEETMALHTSSIKSLSYLDNREFTIIGVERKDYDENKGIKIATSEDFVIEGKKINKFHTTRQAIVRKFLNDTGEPTDIFNAINQPDNSLKVKIFKRKSASDEDYFDLDQC